MTIPYNSSWSVVVRVDREAIIEDRKKSQNASKKAGRVMGRCECRWMSRWVIIFFYIFFVMSGMNPKSHPQRVVCKGNPPNIPWRFQEFGGWNRIKFHIDLPRYHDVWKCSGGLDVGGHLWTIADVWKLGWKPRCCVIVVLKLGMIVSLLVIVSLVVVVVVVVVVELAFCPRKRNETQIRFSWWSSWSSNENLNDPWTSVLNAPL